MGLIPAADAHDDPATLCDTIDYRRTAIVQSHAALLVLSEPDLRVVQASETVASLLGATAEAMLGTTPLSDGRLVPADDLRPLLAGEPLIRPRLVPGIRAGNGKRFTGRLHRTGGRLLLELEPDEHPDDTVLHQPERLLPDLIEATASSRCLGQLLDEWVHRLRVHLRFDRVVVNRFDEDGHGEVVAESRHPDVEPHLGIHFPATDIPSIARQMLAAVPVRVTTDQFADPVPLHPRLDPDSGEGLDLTQVRCRAVGSYCRQYYRNMGVAATLVIPILVHGRLWGHIAARDRRPRRIHPRFDEILESVARLASMSIARFADEARAEAERIAVDVHRSLEGLTPADPGWLSMLSGRLETFRDLLAADGLVLLLGDDTLACGDLSPGRVPLSRIAAVLTAADPTRPAWSHRLRLDHPELDLGGTEIAGALVVPLPSGVGDAVIWLRREQARTVRWAGKPEDAEAWNQAGRPALRPRASFAAWRELTKDTSAPWSADDRTLAETAAMQLGIQLVSFRATQASRSKSEFLANMSHELRTPLTAIMGFAEILHEQAVDSQAAEASGTIRRNGRHLLELINDILDLSKMEAGKLDVTLESVDLPLVVGDVVELLSGQARAGGIDLELEWSGPVPPTIRTDPLRLKQVLLNLVGNAIKFTRRGSVRVRVGHLAAADHGRLVIQIIDTGIGLTAEQCRRIFEPFEQADTSTSRSFGGTGLGLAISQRLAACLGGEISVDSHPGRGSTFTLAIDPGPVDASQFIVPDPATAANREPAETPLPRSTNGPELAGRSILLVEDGPDNQRLIAFHLRKAGARVTLAENGQVALTSVADARRTGCPFDLILMDMQMPVLDGYAATRALRDRGDATPVIALTAHAMTGDRERCLEAGCDDYTTKPIRRATLLATILTWIDRTSPAVADDVPGTTRAA